MKTLTRERLYGPQGWTCERSIMTIAASSPALDITPQVLHINKEDPPEFFRFAGMDHVGAAHLLANLPEANLQEQQNDAPVVKELLHACANSGGDMELVGYLIGPQRFDERVSIEGIILFDEASAKICAQIAQGISQNMVWEKLAKKWKLTSALGQPDEFCQFTPAWSEGKNAWWIWWD